MNNSISTALSVLDRMVRPRISKVTIPVTYECNQRCKTCGIWASYRTGPNRKSEEMTLQEFSRFCRINDLIWIAFTGGEPFLRPDMDDFLVEAMTTCKMVSLTTNGFSSSKVFSDVTKALTLGGKSYLAINVSMNGSKSIHDEISGTPGSFIHAKETLASLRSIKDPRLSIGVSYTSSAYNKWEFNTYLREMADIGIGLENITFGMGQDSPSYYQSKKLSNTIYPGKEYIKEFSEKVLSELHVGTDPLKWVSKKYLDGFIKDYQNGNAPKCVAGQYSLMLDPFWNAYPCMFYCPSKPCGNLRNENLRISNLDFNRCRSIVKTCPGCWTPCETYSTIIFRPWRCL